MTNYKNKYPNKDNLDKMQEIIKGYIDEYLATKQPLIDSSHKLNSDLVTDNNQINKFVSTQEKNTWNNKQEQLRAGIDIKNINNQSILGYGNLNLATKLELENKQDKCTVLYDVEVSNWVSDNTYTGYDYKAEIYVENLTVSDVAFVSFGGDELISGNYLGLYQISADILTIYSKVNTTITIPNIVIIKNLRELQQVQNVNLLGDEVEFDTIPNATRNDEKKHITVNVDL